MTDSSTRKARRPRDAASDYHAKISHEALLVARAVKRAGHSSPEGDPNSGVVLVIEQPVGPRALDALRRSLESIGPPDAYVTSCGTGLLARVLLSAEPSVLIAIGPGSAREIDGLEYPLAQRSFAEAQEGTWFAWTKGTTGLVLPPLAPALDDEESKRRFWRAFLTLRDLAPLAPR